MVLHYSYLAFRQVQKRLLILREKNNVQKLLFGEAVFPLVSSGSQVSLAL